MQGTRPGNVHEWPASGDTKGRQHEMVPAFQFVYSSVSPACTWDVGMFVASNTISLPLFPDAKRYDMLRHARVFTSGTWMNAQIYPWTLIGAEWQANPFAFCPPTLPLLSLLPLPDKADPNVRALIRRGTKLGLGGAKEFFNHGEMVRAEGQDLTPQLSLTHEDPLFGTISFDAVALSAWRLPSDPDRFGIALANADYGTYGAGVAHTIHLPTDLDGVPIPPAAVAAVFNPDTGWVAQVSYGSILGGFTVPANGAMFIQVELP